MQHPADTESRPRWRFPMVELIAVAVIALLLVACFAKGRGFKTWLVRLVYPAYKARPTVVSTRPADFDSNVPLDAFVAADVELPNDGRVVDARTLPPERPDTVRLVRTGDRRPVPAHVNTTGGGDAIVLKPLEPLEPNTQYTFEVTPGVADTGGAPFVYYSARFTTAAAQQARDVPRRVREGRAADAPARATCSHVRRRSAPTTGCTSARSTAASSASTSRRRHARRTPTTFGTVPANNGGPRLVTGFCFDPASTADDAGRCGSATASSRSSGRDDWTGKISRLSGPDLSDYHDVVVNLPRGVKDHLNNQPVFGPDGALYFCQASNTAMGAPDHEWGWRPERLLSAAILRLDVTKLAGGTPLDVKTEDGGAYDPFAAGAPLTIYATGIRNGYDLLFHCNGQLYAPINGSAAGGNAPGVRPTRAAPAPAASTPASPTPAPTSRRCRTSQQTEDDTLLIVERGALLRPPQPAPRRVRPQRRQPDRRPPTRTRSPPTPSAPSPTPTTAPAPSASARTSRPAASSSTKTPGPLAGQDPRRPLLRRRRRHRPHPRRPRRRDHRSRSPASTASPASPTRSTSSRTRRTATSTSSSSAPSASRSLRPSPTASPTASSAQVASRSRQHAAAK